MSDLNKEEIKKILEIAGKARGAVFQTDARYVLEKKGKKGLEILKEEIKKTGQPISYDEKISATSWYPLSWRVLSLLTIQRIFNWGEKEIFEMGTQAPKYSFIVKALLKYFVSLEKTFTESAKYWEEHYSVGKLGASEIDIKGKHLVLCLKDFKTHPILCPYFKGYFKAVAQFSVKTEKMTIKETKCMFRGDPYHEFVIDWE